ncbi:MAG: nucleoside-triphosphatase [Thermoanaerobaculales bacterium]
MKRVALALALAAAGLAFAPHPAGPVLALLAALAAARVIEPTVWRTAWQAHRLALIAVAALASVLLVAWAAGPARAIAAGAAVVLRLLTLALLAGIAVRHLDAEKIRSVAARAGMARLGLALSLALNCLPQLGEAARDAWIALAVRDRRRRPRLRHFPRLAEVLLAHTGRVADEAAAAAALRGQRAFALPVVPLPPVPLLVVVTGSPGAGKTPAMIATARALSEANVAVAGFVQIPVWGNVGKSGYRVRDVATGMEQTLATKVGDAQGEHGTPFRFSRSGFAFARRSLARVRKGSVLVLDELGPVELRGGGHMPAVRRALAQPGLAAALVTVRPVLIPVFLAQLAMSAVVIVEVASVADPVAALLAALRPALGSEKA